MSRRTQTAETEATGETTEETGGDETGRGELVTTGDGVLTAGTTMADIVALGFSESATIKISDPQDGGVLAYAGELIGPGPDIELNDKASGQEGATIPTWLFHPLNIKDPRNPKVVRNITHKVICPAALDGICKGLQSIAQANPTKRVQASMMWDGKGKNRLGQPLNKFRSAHRMVNEDGSVYIVEKSSKAGA